LSEGLLFKRLSERPSRIENEIIAADPIITAAPVAVSPELSTTANISEVMLYEREKLSGLVFKREDSKLRLETIMSNREMVTRMIFDHKTALEALKVTKQGLQEESERLAQDFNDLLAVSAAVLGELSWKNSVVHACNEISALAKT
jgi:TATA-box binding protein (TBP) (component of TFIID and TFIIIB)